MKRKFTPRETVLLAILMVLLIGCFYYFLVDQPVRETLVEAGARKADAQAQLDVETIRLNKMKIMEGELSTLAEDAQADVPDYDNAQNVVILLNSALSQADSYNLSFGAVDREGAIARRSITMNYTCTSYAEAKKILAVLEGSEYRCRVTSVAMNNKADSSSDEGDMKKNQVESTVAVVFYEYLQPDQREQEEQQGTAEIEEPGEIEGA